jgi:DNA polymerase beta
MELNNKLANLMSKLSDLMMKIGEPMKSRAYKKAEETILGMETEITSVDSLKGKPGIGPTILNKIQEYLETGKLALIEREENKPEVLLTNVYGIGPQKAKELVSKGILTIDDLKKHQNEVLNDVQKKGLKYYEDILERIPRIEIDEYNNICKTSFNKYGRNDAHFEIVGSYRRGLSSSGDIDIIVTSSSPTIFEEFIDDLISKK